MAETSFSLADKLLGWCFTVLLAALALKIAVDVISSIWPRCWTGGDRVRCLGWVGGGAVVALALSCRLIHAQSSTKSGSMRPWRVCSIRCCEIHQTC